MSESGSSQTEGMERKMGGSWKSERDDAFVMMRHTKQSFFSRGYDNHNGLSGTTAITSQRRDPILVTRK
jgi:hypothetical protein